MKLIQKYTLLCAIFFLLSACGKPQLSTLNSDQPILAFGDSLTLGVGVQPEYSYPAVLQKLTGIPVINAGISGETTELGLKRFEDTLLKYQPQLIILLEGGNDILRNIPLHLTEANLRNMIIIAQNYQIDVLLVGVPKKSIFSNSAELYYGLASEFHLPLEDEILSDLVKRLSMKSDHVHFNEKGYQALAEAIFLKLQNSNALPKK